MALEMESIKTIKKNKKKTDFIGLYWCSQRTGILWVSKRSFLNWTHVLTDFTEAFVLIDPAVDLDRSVSGVLQ